MILDPTGTAPTRVRGHSARNSALTLLAALTVASFTALAMFRATPVRLQATTRVVEHQLPDGVTLRLEPGSSAQIVRDFSLWWGSEAKPRLITVHRGRGVIASAEGARPFVVETRDAQVLYRANRRHGSRTHDAASGKGPRAGERQAGGQRRHAELRFAAGAEGHHHGG